MNTSFLLRIVLRGILLCALSVSLLPMVQQESFAQPPTVTGFTPMNAGVGTLVTITGTNFAGVVNVTFGGVPASGFTVLSASTITATVAAGSASGSVAVTTDAGMGMLGGFTFFLPPTITSFLPTTAGGGTVVTINGTNFTGATAVSFGGMAAAGFTVVSATQITATVPAGGATGAVQVTTPGGSANMAGFTFVPPPTITMFAPISAPTGGLVTITGTNFVAPTTVSFGGTAATGVTVVSPTQITANVAAGATGAVQVTTLGGMATQGGFTYLPAPTVASFTPMTAGPTMVVTINGANFTGATAVSFGGVAAAGFMVVSATQITATVPAGGMSGSIQVTTPGGSANLAGFTFLPTPTITGIAPGSGVQGTLITITGTGFVAPASVTFGGMPATGVMVMSATQITANVGAGASGNVIVTTPGGVSAPFGGFVYPAPTIASFAPTSQSAGMIVTINGNNFTGATQVQFGGVNAASFTVVSNTVITATVAAGSANGNVRVVTPGGSVNLAGFTFLAPPPTITMFTPMSAGNGIVVTITGTNFSNVTGVSFGGTAATGFTVVSATQITATVGAGANGSVQVTTLSGVANLAGFTWVPAPTVTGFIPTMGGMGTMVTITGTDFTGATQVRFGGTPAMSFMVISPTQIDAIVGLGSTGVVQVTTPGGIGTSAGVFTHTAPPPTITNFTPVNGGNGTVVTITGTNFFGATAVSFGGTPAASFTVISPTQINATVAAGATGSVQVTAPGGMASMAGFTWFPPPTISGFSPMGAGTTTVVTINGNNFTGATQVRFGGINAAAFTVVSNTVMTAVVPAGAVSGNITVITPDGTANLGGYTFVPAPTVTSFLPTSGGTGTMVTITGTNFTAASTVNFGGVPASSVTYVSPTQLTAVVGAGASGNVQVVTVGGPGAMAGFTFVAAPTITNFTPMAGITGTLITINGTNFTGATQVQFGGVNATGFTVVSANQITATVGAGANGSVSVMTPGGTASLGGFIHSFMAPTITGISPLSAGAGTTVMITGTNFSMVTQVQFGGVNATSYTVISPTQINAVVGAGATGNVSVTTAGGTSNFAGFTWVPPPTITSYMPASGGLGNVITINGTNFTGATQVQFGGTNATSFTVVSAMQITATVGIGASGNVSVTTPGGTATSAGFTYVYFPPTITSFTPTSQGGGNTVTINGTNFVGVTAVSFGGVNAMSFTIVSPTQLTAVVGAAGGSGNVQVTTPGGTATQGGFTYIPSPVITSFTPTSMGATGVVNIFGTNFTGATAVSFGGTPAFGFTVMSSTLITATVGLGASGSVSVTTPAGTGTLPGFTFLAAPTITSFMPTSGPIGTLVTINGTGFTGATQVRFGGVNAASFTVVSATQITATVAPGSASGFVSVTAPGGTAASGGFTFIPPPTITGIAPTSMGTGGVVVIMGTGFTGATAVSFGGIPAAAFTVISATQINATVGAGATGNVDVTTPGGTTTFAGFTFVPGPMITSFAPTSAGPGMTVTIYGSGFTGATSVTFGGMASPSITVFSPSVMTAVVPAVGASGNIVVTTPGGSNPSPGFTWVPPPNIVSFMPVSGGPGTVITINGMNFTGATTVRFGGTLAPGHTVVSPTQITATVVAGSTTGAVSVTTAGGTANLVGFTYIAPAPTISSFTPMIAGTGIPVTINGTFLSGPTAVTFGGVPAASWSVMSDNQIIALPAAGASGNVSVTTSGGMATSPGFMFAGTPTITSFLPTAAASGATVTIMGTNFGTATQVQFSGVNAASFMIVSATQINAVVPANATSGSITVMTAGGTTSLAGFTFLPPPTISGFTPASAGTGMTVTITGTNFTGASGVSFGGTNASGFTVVSPTQITAVVAGGTTGVVSVVSTGGLASRSGFTWVATPFITSVTPSTAGTGSVVTILGGHFTGATAASFGGVPATNFTINNSNQITAVVGAGASGNVAVSSAGGTGTFTGFNFVNIPTITGFTPTTGEPGTVVTITGTNFTGAIGVSFGSRPATTFTVVSATQITAVVPANAGDIVSVATPGGTATAPGFMFLPAPRISSFAPATAGVGQMVVITGTNFTGATEVLFGGVRAASFNVVSATQITALVAADGASGDISVTTPEGTGTRSGFTFIYPSPSISDFSPKIAGPGMTISITGTGFLNVSAASLGGVPVARFSVASSREMTVVVGSTGATGAVAVRTPGGTASALGFMFVPAPVITSINPPTAIPGTTVTITGVNLSGVTAVSFGGLPAMFTVLSNTEIRAVVPSGGAVSVTSQGGTAVSSGFTTIPPPAISSFSPTTSGSNATITIQGFHFTAASHVRFGGVTAASFQVVSANQIVAVVSTGATGSVSVTTTAGTATLQGYVYVPAPTVTDVSPKIAGSAQTITIRGTNLSTVRQVWFGGTTAASFSALSNTQIEAVIGTGATGSVTVATIGGIASTSGFVYVPAPVITRFSPQAAEIGTTVTIEGRNFTGASAVRLGSFPPERFAIVSDSVITAVIGANSSNGNVTVQTIGGLATAQGFRFLAPQPAISDFRPTLAGRGMEVIINGSNFANVQAVRFGGTLATSFTVISSRQIAAIVSTGATGSVEVQTESGKAEQAGFAFAAPPVITRFSPASGGNGSTITIDGTGFINVREIRFGGVPATDINQLEPTRITAVVSTGATGAISITALGGTGSIQGFTFINAPTITNFTPTATGGRTTVTITGTNFVEVAQVRFGGVAAISFEAVSTTVIRAIVPEGARSGAVSVTAAGGTATLEGFQFLAPPTVSNFNPVISSPGSTITITGTNFTTTATVSFGGIQSPSVTFVSATELRAVVPQGTTGGTVSVTTLGGTDGVNGFSLLSPPRITSFAPVRASSGTVVTVTGANFTGLSSVRFGGVEAASFRLISDTRLEAVVGTGATGSVAITASNGTASLAGFTFIAPPVITAFSPRGAGRGLAVTIIGSNFTAASAVSFGGVPAARFTLVSPTQITAIVGAGGASGNVSVTAEGGTGTSSGFTFIPAPVIASITPSSGAVNTTLVITGQAFTRVASVVVGNVSVPFRINSDTQITVVIPLSGVTTGNITLTSPGGVGISEQVFTYIPPPSITESSFAQSRQGFVLRIAGANFNSTQNVRIGAASVPFTVISPTQVNASIPAGVTPTDVVTVVTLGGMARTVGMPILPAISNVAPSRGRPGTRIVITGRNLAGATQASIGGVAITPQVLSATEVALTIPQEGASGVIGLTTPFGVVSTTTTFTLVTNAPLITSFSPTRGDGGTVIQMFGENFGTVTSVSIGGVQITQFRLISTSEMILTIPRTGATSGNIVISSPTGIATSQERFIFTPGGVVIEPPVTPQGTVRTYPNPASESLTIAYNLASPQVVTLRIIDVVQGNVLATFPPSAKSAGEQTETLIVRNLPPGTYLISLETPIQRARTLFTVVR